MPITTPKGRLIMGIIFFILFTLAEIALVVLTFTKFREKVSWRRNRAIIRAAEVGLLLGMILIPTVNMKWRFFGALIVLAVRLLIAGIVWLVMRKRANGLRKKPVTVISCVLSVVLIAFSLVPAFIFTNYSGLPTMGEYKVSEASVIIVDKNRVDGVENDGSFREVPAHFYYPEKAEGKYPLVIFSHGAFGYYQSNFSTYAELASNGYIVKSFCPAIDFWLWKAISEAFYLLILPKNLRSRVRRFSVFDILSMVYSSLVSTFLMALLTSLASSIFWKSELSDRYISKS